MSIRAYVAARCDSLTELLDAETAGRAPGHDVVVYVLQGARLVPYSWSATQNTWQKAGWAISLDSASALSMGSGGQLSIDPSGFATAAQGAKADTALQSEQFSVPYLPGSTTFTKMPSADAELPDINSRQLLDLTRFNSFRVTGRVSVIGFPGSNLRFQYAVADSSPYADLYSMGSILFILGEQDTGWCPLPMLAKIGSVFLRLMGKGGDGHVGPQISQLTLSFKS